MAAAVAVVDAFTTTFGKWQPGDVIPCLAGDRPVSMLARVGEHRGLEEYARVNVMPRFARRSMFGVRYSDVVPYSVVSL